MDFSSVKYTDNTKYFKGVEAGAYTGSTRIRKENGVAWIEFPAFDRFDWLRLTFSTRLGGVSAGYCSAMNFSFDVDDTRENVLKNFDLFTGAIGISKDKCVFSRQTHTTHVLHVGKSHLGMGIVRPRDFDNIDGLVTNEPGVCLVTSYADCIPVFLADPVTKCIAAVHSGWRGTVCNIVRNAIHMMENEFGAKADDICAVMGPGICMDCYEVSADVTEKFAETFSQQECRHLFYLKENGKYQLNLHMANYFNLVNQGINPQNISISDICTACNHELLFSHRATHGKRGLMCGFIYIL